MNVLPPLEGTALFAAFDGLDTYPGLPQDWVLFRRALVKAQLGIYAAIETEHVRLFESSNGDANPKRAALAKLRFDPDLLSGFLRDLVVDLEAQEQGTKIVAGLLAAAKETPELLTDLAQAACTRISTRSGDGDAISSRAESLGLSADILEFFGLVLAAPFVSAAARTGTHFIEGEAEGRHGGCPTCGAAAAAALLVGEEGRRLLCCPLCASTYSHERMPCPSCGGTENLGVLREDDDSNHWLETCEDCDGFIRTFDTRMPGFGRAGADVTVTDEGEGFFPLIAVTATLYLDLIAEEQGYRGTVPYAALR
jgi:hypothetical protein